MNFDDYKVAIPFPVLPSRPVFPKGPPACRLCGKGDKANPSHLPGSDGFHEFSSFASGRSADPTPEQLRLYADEVEQWEESMREYELEVARYRRAEGDSQRRFQNDILRECGLEGHPKADDVCTLAWEEGHSEGYSGVALWVRKLADLVR